MIDRISATSLGTKIPPWLARMGREATAATACAIGTLGILDAIFGGHEATYRALAWGLDHSTESWWAFPTYSLLFGVLLLGTGLAILKHSLWWVLTVPGLIVALRAGVTLPRDGHFSHLGFRLHVWAGQFSFFGGVVALAFSMAVKAYRAEANGDGA